MIIGSIGIGLLILIIVWILALITFVIGVKFQSNLSWIALISATGITIVLAIIPLENKHEIIDDKPIEKDYHFVYSTILLSFLLFSALIGFILFFILHCIEPIRPKPLKAAFSQQNVYN